MLVALRGWDRDEARARLRDAPDRSGLYQEQVADVVRNLVPDGFTPWRGYDERLHSAAESTTAEKAVTAVAAPAGRRTGPVEVTVPFASEPLQIISRIIPGRVTMTVRGEVDLDTAPQLRQKMTDVLSHGPEASLHLDLSGVSFMDSAGLLALFTARRTARLMGGDLVLTRTSPQVARLLAVTGAELAVGLPDCAKSGVSA